MKITAVLAWQWSLGASEIVFFDCDQFMAKDAAGS